MNVLVEQFLDYLSSERGLSPNTRAAYGVDLNRFSAFLHRRGIASPNAVTRQGILEFLMSEKDAGASISTISRRLVAIKVFFAYLQREGLLAKNVTAAMDSPKLWRVLPGVLSQREVERLLDAPVGEHPLVVRDRAIIELMYASGLRVSEVAGLSLDDVRTDENYLRCLGKGSKTRVVPFGGKAKVRLQQYLAEARPALMRERAGRDFFVTRRGRRFSRKGLWKMVRAYARRACPGKRVTPHSLRHSFASHLLANGAPIRVIQEMLGHADVATTQIYTHVDDGRLRSVHARYHPRA
jgi:integrase/recombinase XerD